MKRLSFYLVFAKSDIEVPLLEDIIVPALTEFEATDTEATAPSPTRKRKSNVSYSVAGANLRRKRRRL